MPLWSDAPAIVLKALLVGAVRQEESTLVLDTGAGYTLLNREMVSRLGYDPDGSSQRVDLITAEGLRPAPIITLDAIEVLGVRVRNVEVACHSIPEAVGADGVLGLSFLRHTNLALNFKDGILTLEDP